jgi:hypothetical protein
MGGSLGFFPILGIRTREELVKVGIGLEFGEQLGVKLRIVHDPLFPFFFIYVNNIGHIKPPGNSIT